MEGLAKLWLVIIVALILATAVSIYSGRTRFVSDIASLFPSVAENSIEAAALESAKRQVSNRILFLVGHADENVLAQSLKILKQKLSASDGLVISDIDDKEIGRITALHATGLGGFASPKDRQILRSERSGELIQRSLAALYMPGSSVHSGSLAEDPLGLYPAFLTHMSESLGTPGILGYDGRHYSRLTAFISDELAAERTREKVLDEVDNGVAEVQNTVDGLKILYIGGPYYAKQIAQTSKIEAGRITAIALVGIVLLLLVVYRSFQPILGALCIISAGIAAGAAATMLIFGTVHLIAVAFGSSLVGVVVDYAIHFYSARRDTESAVQTAKRIRSGLALGTGTSILGFLALAFSNIDILQQIAVYSAFGVAAAAASVLFVIPHFPLLYPAGGYPNPSDAVRKIHQKLMPSSLFPALCVVSAALAAALLMEIPSPLDTVQSLRVKVPELTNIEAEIAKIDRTMSTRILLVSGANSEEILQREEFIQDALLENISKPLVGTVWGVSTLIPSLKRQNEIIGLKKGLLRSNAAAPLISLIPKIDISAAGISLNDKNWALLPGEIQDLRVPYDNAGEQGHLMIVQGVRDAAALDAVLASLDWISPVDATASYTSGLAKMRQKATLALLGGILVIGVLFIVRIGLLKGARAMIVPTAASLSSLIISALLGSEITFFSVMASFLVFALGADYALFQMAAKPDDKDRAYLAVSLSALSTILVFGLLASSAIPVLQIMGVVVVIGVIIAWALAPLSNTPVKEI